MGKATPVCVQCGTEIGLIKWNGVVACRDCIEMDIRDTDQLSNAIDEYIDKHGRVVE